MDTVDSLKEVTEAQWTQMGIPVGLVDKIKSRLKESGGGSEPVLKL